jgi:hypothetical protein
MMQTLIIRNLEDYWYQSISGQIYYQEWSGILLTIKGPEQYKNIAIWNS